MKTEVSMRGFLLTAVLVLAGPLSLLATVDRDLLALVPPTATRVAGIDVARARSSPFGQHVMSRINVDSQQYEEFIRDTHFDPRQDLESLMFANTGNGGKSGNGVILARGNFDADRIKETAKAKGATIRAYHGFEIIVQNAGKRGETGFAFPLPGIAVMGDLGSVQQVVANSASPSVLDVELQRQIENTGARNDAWFVSLAGAGLLADHLMFETNGQGERAKALQSVLRSSGGIRFGNTIDVNFDAITRSPQDAKSLTDVVRFLASMVQMERQKDPRAGILAASLDNMSLKASGETVHISFSVSEKDMEQLAESAPRPFHGSRR